MRTIGVVLMLLSAPLAIFAATHGHPPAAYIGALASLMAGVLIALRENDRRFAAMLKTAETEENVPPAVDGAKTDAAVEELPAHGDKEATMLPPPPGPSERPYLRLVHTDGKKLELRNRPPSTKIRSRTKW